ncbi:hypothetical protein [Natrialba chahannaoensis]|uniref:hypothetical protein n=1 Tax=Natrialba chahannaoensis TaxID=68911 RepID=UPI0012696F03|nr:hypothetical protein [Natrialba chahannaoensis]
MNSSSSRPDLVYRVGNPGTATDAATSGAADHGGRSSVAAARGEPARRTVDGNPGGSGAGTHANARPQTPQHSHIPSSERSRGTGRVSGLNERATTRRSDQASGFGNQSASRSRGGSRTDSRESHSRSRSPVESLPPGPHSSDANAASGHTQRREPAAESSTRTGDPSQRTQRGSERDLADVPWGDDAVQFDADVDRIVERLYRRLDRKQRIERERRGL